MLEGIITDFMVIHIYDRYKYENKMWIALDKFEAMDSAAHVCASITCSNSHCVCVC
jgi:hypothetical protein